MIIRVHSLLGNSTVNGPGKRCVVWTQGCSLDCPCCWNPETHDHGLGQTMNKYALLGWITQQRVDGVTFSGGEPMQQAPALFEIVSHLRKFYPSMSIGMFTGYSEWELQNGNYSFQPTPGYEAEYNSADYRKQLWEKGIRPELDFAILGRYNQQKPAAEPFTTSTNQQLCIYSSRHTASDFDHQSVEVQIGTDGLVQLTGFPTKGF